MNSESGKTYIVNDQPTETDALDFTPYVETLADIIQTGNTPLTIGVFGTWGSGKTSLMKMVKNKLPGDFTIAWFDAQKYDKEETLWRAFLLCVLSATREKALRMDQPVEVLDVLESLLYGGLNTEKIGEITIDLSKLGGKVAQGAVQINFPFASTETISRLVTSIQQKGGIPESDEIIKAITHDRAKIHIEQVRFQEQFYEKFRALIEEYISPNRFIVFVDGLDRTSPEKSIEILEAINLFADTPFCVFIIGLDRKIIERGVEIKYKGLTDVANYLEKVVTLPFQMPSIRRYDIRNLITSLMPEFPHPECAHVLSEAIGDNPRYAKRMVVAYQSVWELSKRKYKSFNTYEINPVRLAKLISLQFIFPELYSLAVASPGVIGMLEKFYRSGEKYVDGQEKILFGEFAEKLSPYIFNVAVRNLLTMHSSELTEFNFIDLPTDRLQNYFELTKTTFFEEHVDITYTKQPQSSIFKSTSNTNSSTGLKIFLCHASSDKPIVRELYSRLKIEGYNVWFDEESLLPGTDWRDEIPKAVKDSDIVMVCLSRNSITKQGYIQKEIKLALDASDEKPEDIIYIIPAKLEDCEVPTRLGRWQWVDLYKAEGYKKLLTALEIRFASIKNSKQD